VTERDQKSVVYFHIGAPKTGTTFLQRALWQNRESLAKAGVLYPGDTFAAQVHAAFDLRKAGFQGYQDPRTAGAWESVVTQARAWTGGPVIISQELFSPATTAQIDTALADLSFAEVHLLYTARELSRQIPAAWQEDLKNRFTPTFDEFVTAVRHPERDRTGLGRMFWRMQDAPEVLKRWTRGIPADHVHVITVPGQADPPDLLWRRFAGVVGIDPDSYDTSGAFTNTSLGAAEATFLRRLNLALDDEVGWPLYNEMVKHHLAQEVLAQRDDPQRTPLQPDDAIWAAERSEAIVGGLAAAGYDIVGTLDDLLPTPTDESVPPPAEPSATEQLDIAMEAIAALLLRISRLRRKVIQR
jgi:hypothetical protein